MNGRYHRADPGHHQHRHKKDIAREPVQFGALARQKRNRAGEQPNRPPANVRV